MSEIQKCTLVPTRFFDGKAPRFFSISKYDVILVCDGDYEPALYRVILSLDKCCEYNKIVVLFDGYAVHLAIAQGENLLLANSYPATDFVTAQYYIFAALKTLQINPEVSSVCFLSEIGEEERMSLYRYFKGVDQL